MSKIRLTEAERLRRYPLSMDDRVGYAIMTLITKCGIEGEPSAGAILTRHGVSCTSELPLKGNERQVVLDEIEAEITRLQAGLPPEALAEIARLRSYYITRER
jgi:hypothetical protein